ADGTHPVGRCVRSTSIFLISGPSSMVSTAVAALCSTGALRSHLITSCPLASTVLKPSAADGATAGGVGRAHDAINGNQAPRNSKIPTPRAAPNATEIAIPSQRLGF